VEVAALEVFVVRVFLRAICSARRVRLGHLCKAVGVLTVRVYLLTWSRLERHKRET